jgi:hypothetical protein
MDQNFEFNSWGEYFELREQYLIDGHILQAQMKDDLDSQM